MTFFTKNGRGEEMGRSSAVEKMKDLEFRLLILFCFFWGDDAIGVGSWFSLSSWGGGKKKPRSV